MKSFPFPSSHTLSISSAVGLDFPQQWPQLCYICLLFGFVFFSSLYNYYLYHLLLFFVPFHLFPPKEALASLSLLYGCYGLYGPTAFRWVLGPLFFTFLFSFIHFSILLKCFTTEFALLDPFRIYTWALLFHSLIGHLFLDTFLIYTLPPKGLLSLIFQWVFGLWASLKKWVSTFSPLSMWGAL